MFRAFPLSGNRAVDLLSVLSQADQRRALRYARVRSKDTRGDCAWGCREGVGWAFVKHCPGNNYTLSNHCKNVDMSPDIRYRTSNSSHARRTGPAPPRD